jgi:hypothetical protein
MAKGLKPEPDTLRDASFDAFLAPVDPINGVDISMMMRNLTKTPAERLRYNTGSAIAVGRLYNIARRKR